MRDYKKEYREYHSSNKQKKLRALRNKANRTMSPGPGKEVDHKVPLSKGGSNGESNWRVVSRKTNREKYDKTASEFDWATAGHHAIVPGAILGGALAAKGYGHYSNKDHLKNIISDRKGALIGSLIGGAYGSSYGEEPSIVNALAGSGIGYGIGTAVDSIIRRRTAKQKLQYFNENKAALIASKAGATALGAIAGLPGVALGGELGTQLGAKIDEKINKKEASIGPLAQFMKLSEEGVATKTNPDKWEEAKRQAKAKMGGKHSARAMQLATQIYKKNGGGYSGNKPSASNNKLKKWTKQKWQWSGERKKEANAAIANMMPGLRHLPAGLVGGLGLGYIGLKAGLDDPQVAALLRSGFYTGIGTSSGIASNQGLSHEDVLYPLLSTGVAQLPLALADGLGRNARKYGNIVAGHLGGAYGLYQAGKARMRRSREKKAFFEGSHYFTDDPVKNTIRMATPIGAAILGGIANSYAGNKAGIEDEAVLGSLFGAGVASGFGAGEILTGTPGINYRHVLYPYLGATGLGSLSGLLPDSKATSRAGVYLTGAGGMAGRMIADRNTEMLKESKSKGVYLPARSIAALKSTEKGKAKLRAAAKKKTEATNKGQQFSNHGLHKGKDR